MENKVLKVIIENKDKIKKLLEYIPKVVEVKKKLDNATRENRELIENLKNRLKRAGIEVSGSEFESEEEAVEFLKNLFNRIEEYEKQLNEFENVIKVLNELNESIKKMGWNL